MERKRLCGNGWGWGCSSGVDVGAEQSLSKNGEDAAFGLLALGGADVDELVDTSGSGGG
jgi:hypothetical protein